MDIRQRRSALARSSFSAVDDVLRNSGQIVECVIAIVGREDGLRRDSFYRYGSATRLETGLVFDHLSQMAECIHAGLARLACGINHQRERSPIIGFVTAAPGVVMLVVRPKPW